MTPTTGYVLGQSVDAARRLEIQDAHFADVSEQLLDDLKLGESDQVVELGCGAGSFSRRLLRRLGSGGQLTGVDITQGLLDQASQHLAGSGVARFTPVLADIGQPGAWAQSADVVVARTVLHHVPMVEFMLGKLLSLLRPGTRLGFIEPDFRSPLAKVAFLEATGRSELAPLKTWAVAINQLYQASRLSPAIGASLSRTLELAGCRDVQDEWQECRSDHLMIENMLMFYDEVRARLNSFNILTLAEIDEQKKKLEALKASTLPPVWALHRVTAHWQ